jgi:hypothetical protein
MPVWARQLVAEEVAELERQEIRGALLEAGILWWAATARPTWRMVLALVVVAYAHVILELAAAALALAIAVWILSRPDDGAFRGRPARYQDRPGRRARDVIVDTGSTSDRPRGWHAPERRSAEGE